MKSIAMPATKGLRSLSVSSRSFLISALFVFTFCAALLVSTEYTKKDYVVATVIGKTEAEPAHKGNWDQQYTLALRHPDGVLQEVHPTYAEYTATQVGSKWDVMYSDFDRGLPMPVQDRVRMAVLMLSFLGAFAAFFWSLVCWSTPQD